MNESSQDIGHFDLPKFWRTMNELEDGTIDAAELAELEALLGSSSAARRAYLEYFQQSAVLHMEAAKQHERGLLPLVDGDHGERRNFQRSLLAAAALVTLAAMVAALFVVARPDPAKLVAEMTAETQWTINGVAQSSTSQNGVVTEGASVSVGSGIVRLTMDSGAEMAIQGPASVSFPSPHRPVLETGWLWIDAKAGERFHVEAGDLQIRNIGTRFGVRAQRNRPSEIHLIKGRLELRKLEDGSALGRLAKPGQAQVFSADGMIEEIVVAMDPFPSLPDLLNRPADYRTTVLAQSPVGYWPLDASPDQEIANKIEGSSIGYKGHGVRSGEESPRTESGFHGFPADNHSFFFEGRRNESVLSELDGWHGVKHREGAVSFWIRRSDENPRDEVLWLAGLGDGDSRVTRDAMLHTRLNASGQVIFEAKNDEDDLRLESPQSIADGRWHHVVASWGPLSVDLYLNGGMVARETGFRTPDEKQFRGRFVRFGKPSLDQPNYHSFMGWADEIALWDRPLTPAEVASQYQSAIGVRTTD